MHLIRADLSSLLCCLLPVQYWASHYKQVFCRSKLVWLFCRQESNANCMRWWMWSLDLMVDMDNLA